MHLITSFNDRERKGELVELTFLVLRQLVGFLMLKCGKSCEKFHGAMFL